MSNFSIGPTCPKNICSTPAHCRYVGYCADSKREPEAPRSPAQPDAGQTLQQRVGPWLLQCFGEPLASEPMERNHRFLEEAVELVQACGCTRSEAHQLVDYVFDRPVGEMEQEVGGVMISLAALCRAQGIDMHEAGDVELLRVWARIDKIRAKQAAKPKHSPLPEAPRGLLPPEPPAHVIEAICQAHTASKWPEDFGEGPQAIRRKHAREAYKVIVDALAGAPGEFKPTHRHAEGDMYQVIAPCKVHVGVDTSDQEATGDYRWMEAVRYRNAHGMEFVREKVDFDCRFTELPAAAPTLPAGYWPALHASAPQLPEPDRSNDPEAP